MDVIQGPLISDDEDEDNNEDVEPSPANLEVSHNLTETFLYTSLYEVTDWCIMAVFKL